MANNQNELQHLALRASKGDESALSALYRHMFPDLYRFGLKVSSNSNQDNVQDAIQSVFLWLAQNYTKIKQIENIEAYLYLSVRKNLIRSLGEQERKRQSQQKYKEHTKIIALNYQHSGEDHLIFEEELLEKGERLKNALSKLPEYQRTALHLRYFEERSYEEMAKMMGTNQQVARNFVSRAIKSMRKVLKATLSILL